MNGKTFLLLALILCLLLTGQACCVNPQMNSLKAAYGLHGDDERCPDTNTTKNKHKCMVDVFISNAPFPPSCKKLIHENLEHTGDFYHDKSFDQTLHGLGPSPVCYPDYFQKGMDTDVTNGIDTTMLFFHVGHGNELFCDEWGTTADDSKLSCREDFAHTKYMKLGNCESGNEGMLRYFWQCSCNVFAHGPNKPQKLRDPDTGIEVEHANYPSPQYYDGSNDSPAMRNVYERWGPALGSDLRMACGVSTLAYCDGKAAALIWDYYSGKIYHVADAFIMGLRDEALQEHGEEVIPLCIASGGRFLSNSPLIKDERFTYLPNEEPVPRTNLYIQFPDGFKSNNPYIIIIPPLPPRVADIFRLKIPKRLPPFDRIEFKVPKPPHTDPHIMISAKLDADFGLSVRVNTVSGAVYFFGKQKFDTEPPKLSEAEYIDRAVQFIRHFGLTEELSDDPRGTRMMLQSTSLESKGKTISHAQKNVIVTFKRHIIVDRKPVTVLGDGGEIQVQMNNDGSVINASKVWREIDGVVKSVRVKTYDEAYKEAVQSLKDPEAYHLARWTWGYKELSGSVKQEEMRIVYRFYFWPKKPGPPYSPVRMEIVAQN